MQRVVYHEHPAQSGACLPGAFAAYLDRIPLSGRGDLAAVWEGIRRRPFRADRGAECAGLCDERCAPVQRSRVWPEDMNCWEATAHFVASARQELPEDWTIHVWDRDLPNGARHVWPSLMSPRGEHFIVDLQTVAPAQYPTSGYQGFARPGRGANGDDGDEGDEETGGDSWWNNVLGVTHLVGKTALSIFGMGKAGEQVERVEGDALPEWARTNTPEPTRAPPTREQAPRSEYVPPRSAREASAGAGVPPARPPDAPPGARPERPLNTTEKRTPWGSMDEMR